MQEPYDPSAGRLLNVSLLAGSKAHYAYYHRAGSSVSELTAGQLAAGFPPRPSLNLHNFGGKTIANLVFVNHYLGGTAAWDPADIASIDAALAKAMSDTGLQSVVQQYYNPTITSRMLPSVVLPEPAPATIYKDQVEALAAEIYDSGALGSADPASTLINIMLPRGVVLVDGFSPGFTPAGSGRRARAPPARGRQGRRRPGRRIATRPGWVSRINARHVGRRRHGCLLRRRRLLRGEQRHSRFRPALGERRRDHLPRAQRGQDRSRRGRRHPD